MNRPLTDTPGAGGRDAPVEQFEPGRTIGVIAKTRARDVDGKAFMFIKDAANNEYFAHRSGFVDERDFRDLVEGEGVSFRVSRTSKGKRAFEIRRATAEEMPEISLGEEQRGNR